MASRSALPLARISRLVARVAFVLVCAACTSPTLPLPPPAFPTIGASSTAGKVHLSSERGVEPNALVVVYNRNPAVPLDQRVSGAQADSVGTWDCDVMATPGDYLDISQEDGTTGSPSITVQIPKR